MKPISIMIDSYQSITDIHTIAREAASEAELSLFLEIYKDSGMEGVKDAMSKKPIGTDRMANLVGYELRTTDGWKEVISCIQVHLGGDIHYTVVYKDEPTKGHILDKNGYSNRHRVYQIRPPKKRKQTKTDVLKQRAKELGIPVVDIKIKNTEPDFLEPAFPIIEDK